MTGQPQTRPAPRAAAEPLVERERELALLRTLLDDTLAGEARVALIEGAAGIGKSRLLAELRRNAAAEQDVLVCAARASELERELPFGVVRQLFEPLLAEPETAALLAGPAAGARPLLESGAVRRRRRGPARLLLRRAPRPPPARRGAERSAAAAAVDRRPALVRPSLAALPRLPAAAARLPADPRRRDDPHQRARHRRRDPRRDRARPAGDLRPPRPAQQRRRPRARPHAARRRRREGARPLILRCLRRGHRGNPLLLRQLLAGLASDGVAPTARAPRSSTTSARAPSRAPCC